jgi:acyl-CoA reductase-like NAD-dependent aldehyde dehydrogenase
MTEAPIVRLSIGGEESDATGGRTFTRNNPMTGAPATKAAAAGIEDAKRAAEAAGKAAEAWGQTGPNARRRLLNAAAAELEAAPTLSSRR